MERGERPPEESSIVPECPCCGGDRIEVRDHDGEAVFCCEDCGCGWRFELGYLWRVEKCGSTTGDDGPTSAFAVPIGAGGSHRDNGERP